MLLALVFGAIFLAVLGGLAGFTLSEHQFQTVAHLRTQAFALAETGLEQYRWRLARNLDVLSDESETFTASYADPEGGVTGTFSVSATPIAACGEVTGLSVRSEGVTADNRASSAIVARYARPSVADYSYILNANVHAGADRIINGPYHSNGGVRMDGTANAPVTSSLESWNCADGGGCSSNETVAGVFGAGENAHLWNYPVPQVDFEAITADFPTLKTVAESDGVYLPRISTGQKNAAAYWRGYHLVFNGDDTVTVYRVTATTRLTPLAWVNPADATDDTEDRILIANSVMHGTYTLPDNCGLMYVEDHVWVEGVVSGKVTLVAANSDPAISPNIYVRNNISYVSGSDADGFTAIAEHNVLVAPDAPENLSIRGVLIAQDGSVGRNAYACSVSGAVRDTLTILGSTVSNKRTGTKWPSVTCSGGVSGYQTRIDAYDRALSNNPPPFTPSTSSDFRFVEWREE